MRHYSLRMPRKEAQAAEKGLNRRSGAQAGRGGAIKPGVTMGRMAANRDIGIDLHAGATVADRLADHLLDRICEGKMVGGNSLPSERKLMQEYSISRLACREALAKLRGMGVVNVRHGKGAFLTDPREQVFSPAILRMLEVHGDITNENILEFRELIEPAAVRWAAQRATQRQKHEIVELVKTMEANLAQPDVPVLKHAQQFAEADVAFHQAVAVAGGNKVFPLVFKGLHELLLRVRVEVLIRDPSIITRAIADHRRIVDAIAGGDAAQAEKAMLLHIRQRGRELMERTSR